MSSIRVHHLSLLLKPLTNLELERAVRSLHIPHFRGVFMSDDLPPRPRSTECGILNHDDLAGPGTHWTCWFKDGPRRIYFGPYGLPPPTELRRYLGLPIDHNTDEVQPRGSVICGHLCLYVLKRLSEGWTFEDVVFSLL